MPPEKLLARYIRDNRMSGAGDEAGLRDVFQETPLASPTQIYNCARAVRRAPFGATMRLAAECRAAVSCRGQIQAGEARRPVKQVIVTSLGSKAALRETRFRVGRRSRMLRSEFRD